MSEPEIPVNATVLADRIDRTPFYVHAMKKIGGYQFSHGNRTLVSHALRWIRKNPDFRSTAYRKAKETEDGRKRRPHLPPVAADMSCEPIRSNG